MKPSLKAGSLFPQDARASFCGKVRVSVLMHRQSLIAERSDMTPPQPEYRMIPLTRGQSTLVNAENFPWLIQIKWRAIWSITMLRYYAYANISFEGRSRSLYMARLILGLKWGDKRVGDHINGDTLNNTKENLRIATSSENSRNTRRPLNNTSGFKGVTFNRRAGRWQAQLGLPNDKNLYLGLHDSPEIAHAVYCAAALKHFGEFARLA